jgi:hypothetical protein
VSAIATGFGLRSCFPRRAHHLLPGSSNQQLSQKLAVDPNSTADDNLANSCNLCHTDKRTEFNGYGWDYIQQGFSFSATETLNSDGDPGGATNLEEIEAGTQPGWAEGANNVINGGAVSNNALPAGIRGGVLTTGRSLTLNGADQKSILDTVARAAGVDINSSDYPRYGSGPVAGIFN